MEPQVRGDSTHLYRGWDPGALFDALTTHMSSWIRLHPGEVLPEIVEADRPSRVLWSSFWPVAPDDTVELLVAPSSPGDTTVRLIWRSPSPPDERGIGITRQRLNTKLGGDIRGWLSQLGRSAGDLDRPAQ